MLIFFFDRLLIGRFLHPEEIIVVAFIDFLVFKIFCNFAYLLLELMSLEWQIFLFVLFLFLLFRFIPYTNTLFLLSLIIKVSNLMLIINLDLVVLTDEFIATSKKFRY